MFTDFRLEQENQTLRELFEKQRSEQFKNEQTIRETLVEEFEKQRKQTIDIWQKRLHYVEENCKSKVSVRDESHLSQIYFTLSL